MYNYSYMIALPASNVAFTGAAYVSYGHVQKIIFFVSVAK